MYWGTTPTLITRSLKVWSMWFWQFHRDRLTTPYTHVRYYVWCCWCWDVKCKHSMCNFICLHEELKQCFKKHWFKSLPNVYKLGTFNIKESKSQFLALTVLNIYTHKVENGKCTNHRHNTDTATPAPLRLPLCPPSQWPWPGSEPAPVWGDQSSSSQGLPPGKTF